MVRNCTVVGQPLCRETNQTHSYCPKRLIHVGTPASVVGRGEPSLQPGRSHRHRTWKQNGIVFYEGRLLVPTWTVWNKSWLFTFKGTNTQYADALCVMFRNPLIQGNNAWQNGKNMKILEYYCSQEINTHWQHEDIAHTILEMLFISETIEPLSKYFDPIVECITTDMIRWTKETKQHRKAKTLIFHFISCSLGKDKPKKRVKHQWITWHTFTPAA